MTPDAKPVVGEVSYEAARELWNIALRELATAKQNYAAALSLFSRAQSRRDKEQYELKRAARVKARAGVAQW